MLTSAAASQSARSMRTSTRCSLTMPHPSRSSGGIKIASHFLSLLLSQDWHAQLCPESNANPWSHGHLPKLIHQNTVSRFPFKTGSGILRGTTMRLSWRIRILTCMWGMSLQQVTGWQIEANSMTFSLFSPQSWVSAWLLEGGPNAPCFSLHSPSCMVSHYLSHVSLLREGQTNTKKSQFPRVYETFWFAHGQFMKRWDL